MIDGLRKAGWKDRFAALAGRSGRSYTRPMVSAPQRVRRALISVSDKTGLVPFAAALAARDVTLISTGGSAQALAAAGLAPTEVSAVTGMAEFLDGRVKTLHPAIHAGLLARRDRPEHLAALTERGFEPIDLLVSNLYPFAATVASRAGAEACIENIDIGGPALIRAAAKNHDAVAVVTDPADYDGVLAELASRDGMIGAGLRRALARKAYATTAAYDAAIAEWMAREDGVAFPETLVLSARLGERLRYGENPHQAAALYRTGEGRTGAATARLVQGKELSYNNYADADAAFELAAEFAPPAAVIVKHANPCGVALGANLREAWEKALACDPVSAFGGVAAFNRPLDAATAEAVARLFVEVIIAPEATDEAAAILARRAALRLLATGGMPDPLAPGRMLRSLAGGLLVQERDRAALGPEVAAHRDPPGAERGRDRRPAVRRPGGKARQVERDRLCQGRRHGRHRRRSAEPRRQRADRRAEGGRDGGGGGAGAIADSGARCWPRTRSSRLPTGSKRRSRPAPRR